MQKILVTGGAGFIGSHTVDQLLGKNFQVVVLDNFSTGNRENLPVGHPSLEIKIGDIRDLDVVKDAAKGVTQCLHLAAQVSVVKSLEEPADSAAQNILGFINVLNAVKENNIKRLVYASSAAAYGTPTKLPLSENILLKPESPYGLEKQINEMYADLFRGLYGLSACGLRYFNVYGPKQDPKSPYAGVIALFSDAVLSKKSLKIYGDGMQTRDFIYIQDVVNSNIAALNSDFQGIINVATGNSVTLLELIETIEKVIGHTCKKDFKPGREGDIRNSEADAPMLNSIFGVVAEYSLEDGLRSLLESSL